MASINFRVCESLVLQTSRKSFCQTYRYQSVFESCAVIESSAAHSVRMAAGILSVRNRAACRGRQDRVQPIFFRIEVVTDIADKHKSACG